MYRFNAEDPGQSLYTPTNVGVIIQYLKVFCCIINTIVSLGMPKFMNGRTSTAILTAHKAH